MKKASLVLFTVLLVCGQSLSAGTTDVHGGQTSVLLDTETLSSVGLDLSSVSSDVIIPGELPGSVAFGINSRNAAVLPTTFSYTSPTLAPFSGTIEHMGSVFFNGDTVEVGNFTIGYDSGRAVGDASGFFVESTTGVAAILFDVETPSFLDAGPSALIIEADLLVSPEFAGFLGNTDLTGADVGDARVNAVVPAPGALLLGGIGATLVGYMRKRRTL